jgi:hypothetical protein
MNTPKAMLFLSPLYLSQCCNLRSSNTFGNDGENYTTKQVALEGGTEKERKEIMIKKLNYGDREILVAISNTKVLKK